MSKLICVFCRGKDCKYENYQLWLNSPTHPNAIDGLFSSWITPQILATARPSTRLIQKHGLIQAFCDLNIKAIINLQQPGEHALCGDGVDIASGFSYQPQDFLDAGVKCFNFGWLDMSVPTCERMFDIVQVMAKQLKDASAKIAVHCHAGLGRTGLAIACYLVYDKRVTAGKAVEVVRASRPMSLQTASQVRFVTSFQEYLTHLLVVFPIKTEGGAIVMNQRRVGLREMIANQKVYYQNDDRALVHYVVKPIRAIVEALAGKIKDESEERQCGLERTLCETIQSFSTHTLSMVRLDSIIQAINEGYFDDLADLSLPQLTNLLMLWFLYLAEPFIPQSSLALLETIESESAFQTYSLEMRKETLHTANLVIDLFRNLENTPPDIIYSTLYTLAGLFTPNRQHFCMNTLGREHRDQVWNARFSQPLKREKKQEEQCADELQVHTLRWLQFLLEFRYAKSSIVKSPAVEDYFEFSSRDCLKVDQLE